MSRVAERWPFPMSSGGLLRGVGVAGAQVRANVVCCEKKTRRGGEKNPTMCGGLLCPAGASCALCSSPCPFAGFVMGIALEVGSEESGDFYPRGAEAMGAEGGGGFVQEEQSRSYVQKMAQKKAGRCLGSGEDQVKEVDFWGATNNEG